MIDRDHALTVTRQAKGECWNAVEALLHGAQHREAGAQ
ncbi:MAG: hypothetical protein JWL77_6975 [Chthonomonadaceae bacterium]|nr:hypothetical protein [Chthonomonadaceae bacterium]